MKLKQRPADFQVIELTDLTPAVTGEFALYRLDKSGWTTPDAIHAIRRLWKLDAGRVSYGGLKDRHAMTSQYVTIFRGPRTKLSHQKITLTYLGQVPEPFTSEQIRANAFTVTLRHLTASQSEQVAGAMTSLASRAGVPNYFDDQRFGSVGPDGRFIAREMVLGHFEEALRMALAGEYEFDRAEQRQEKAILLSHWGDWPRCKAALPRGHARSLVDYLVHHPEDFKGAVARLRPELQGLYLSAYQSHVWNRMLDRWIRRQLPPNEVGELELKLGRFAFPKNQEPRRDWATLAVPLPSARWKPDSADEWAVLADEVLAEDGLDRTTMKIPGLQKPYFSRGERPAGLIPTETGAKTEPDELNRGRFKTTLTFELPRGSYATMIVKRVMAG